MWRLKNGKRLVLNVQSDLLGHLDTIAVVPLLRAGSFRPTEFLNPAVQVGGETFLVAVQGITAIRAKDMQDKVADLANEGEAVLRALDRLLTPP